MGYHLGACGPTFTETSNFSDVLQQRFLYKAQSNWVIGYRPLLWCPCHFFHVLFYFSNFISMLSLMSCNLVLIIYGEADKLEFKFTQSLPLLKASRSSATCFWSPGNLNKPSSLRPKRKHTDCEFNYGLWGQFVKVSTYLFLGWIPHIVQQRSEYTRQFYETRASQSLPNFYQTYHLQLAITAT